MNDKTFIQHMLPNGYHVCSVAVDSLNAIRNHTWSTGSVPVGSSVPWYSGLDGADTQETDEFTAWFNMTCLRLGIEPTVTDEQGINSIIGCMANDLIRVEGYTDETADAIATIAAVLAGGAAFVRVHGTYPQGNPDEFVEDWLSKEH